MRRIAFVGAVLFALLVADSAYGSDRVYPPGLEPTVAAWVFQGEGAPLGPGVEARNASIQPDRISVEIGGPDGVLGGVVLTEPSATLDATLLARTPSFKVWVPPEASSDLRRAAEALTDRIRTRDDGSLAAVGVAAREAAPTPWSTSRAGGWIVLVIALPWLLLRAPRRRFDPWLPITLFALALALRLGLPPWAPLHANDHGIAELRDMVSADGPAGPYGGVYAQLVGAVPGGLGPDGVLALGAIFGALAVLLLHRVVALLTPGPLPPALAALGLALHPTHVRLSLSESPRPLAGALLLAGIVAGLIARRSAHRGERALAAGAALVAFALACELRVLTLGLPLVGLVFIALARPEPAGDRPRPDGALVAALVAGGALLSVTAANHARSLAAAWSDAAARGPMDLWGRLTSETSNVLLDPSLTAAALLPMALLGALGLARSGRGRTAVAAVGAAALLLPPSLFVNACRTDAIRYQSEAHLFLFVLASGVVLFPRRDRIALIAAALLTATSTPGLIDLTVPDIHAQAAELVRRSVPPSQVVVPPNPMADERKVRSDFPNYLLATTLHPTQTGPCAVWIGPACWSFTDEEVARGAEGLRSECEALLGGPGAKTAALEHLHEVDVPHRDREFHRIPAARPRLGFAPCPAP